MGFEANAYGGAFSMLLGERRLNALDGDTENGDVRSALDALSVSAAFEGQNVVDWT